jgi:hypothetical protein
MLYCMYKNLTVNTIVCLGAVFFLFLLLRICWPSWIWRLTVFIKLKIIFGGAGVEFGLALVRQVLWHLRHTLGPFCSSCFWDRYWVYAQAGMYCDCLILGFPSSWGDRCALSDPAIVWDGFSGTFLSRLASNHDSLNLYLWVAKITGVIHHGQLKFFFYLYLQIFFLAFFSPLLQSL